LVDKNSAQREKGSDQAFRRNLPVSIKDAFEVFVNIFDGGGTQPMEDASHLNPTVGVRITSIPGRHEQAIGQVTVLAQFWRIGMTIPQNKADFSRNLE
jgi:hypothetical protein